MVESRLPLRDIHLPEPNSWWPPAPGWWLLLLLAIVVVLLLGWLRVKYRRRAVLRSAMSQLKALEYEFKQGDERQRLLRELSELVRRVMISHYHREDVSALVGVAWLRRLDRELECNEFSRGVGAILAHGPYQPQADFDAVQLIALVRRLIKKVLTPQWFGEWSWGWAWVINLWPRLKLMVRSWRAG